MRFYKATNATETHRGLKYKTGVNLYLSIKSLSKTTIVWRLVEGQKKAVTR